MTPDLRTRLARAVAEATAEVVTDTVPAAAPGVTDGSPVHLVPAPRGPGWHSAQARRLAGVAGLAPVDLARAVAAVLTARAEVASASLLGDGLLHLVLTPEASGTVVAAVRRDVAYGVAYGAADDTAYRDRVRRPTGPAIAPPGPGERLRGHPAFDVLWAHARATTAVFVASALGVGPAADVGGLLAAPEEDALLTALAAFPDDVERATGCTHLLRRLADLAGRTHTWLDDDPVVPRTSLDPVEPVHAARAALAAATAQVLATGLDLLGLPAPERV